MPYIKMEDRPIFDTMVDGLIKRTKHFNRGTISAVVTNLLIYGLTREAYPFGIDSITDGIIKDLAKRIRVRGDANYIVCRVVLESMKPEKGWSYHSLSDAVLAVLSAHPLISFVAFDNGITSGAGYRLPEEFLNCQSVIDDVCHEIHRRLLDPYEDTAIAKNGDMVCFQEDFAYKPHHLLAEQMIKEFCATIGIVDESTPLKGAPACGGQGTEFMPFTDAQIAAYECEVDDTKFKSFFDQDRGADEG